MTFFHTLILLPLAAPLCACNVSTLGPPLAESTTEGSSTTSTTSGETADTSGGDSSGGDEIPTDCEELESRTRDVLTNNCTKCHGEGSVGRAGIDYIADLGELIARAKIVPGVPEESRVHVRMSADALPMPPREETQRPGANDIEAVRRWISGCAQFEGCANNDFIPVDAVLEMVRQDLSTLPLNRLTSTRYLSFVHLHNAGWCEADIAPQREALAVLINSLSQDNEISAPQPIDERGLLLRIDTTDYGWTIEPQVTLSEDTEYYADAGKAYNDRWDMIAGQDPYAIVYMSEAGLAIAEDTGTFFPLLQADAFIDVAARAPLYYDILGIPQRVGKLLTTHPDCTPGECLETKLGLNLLAEALLELADDEDTVARAGMYDSAISGFNRVVERHQFPEASNRVLWLTHDFHGRSDAQNVGAHPLDFESDAHAILYTLPNGLQAYMLADAAGNRRNEAPSDIMRDEAMPDDLVRGAVSCIGCHVGGVLAAVDDVRHDLDNGTSSTAFSDQDKDYIRKLYPTRGAFAELLQLDIARFRSAVEQCGVPSNGEPVLPAFLKFSEDVDLRRAAAELGLPAQELAMKLGELSNDLDLLAFGGAVRRADFTYNFAASVCRLDLEQRTRCCPEGVLLPECGG